VNHREPALGNSLGAKGSRVVRMKLDLVGGMIVEPRLVQRVRFVNLLLITSGTREERLPHRKRLSHSRLTAGIAHFHRAELTVCHRVFISAWPNLNKRCLSWLFLHQALPLPGRRCDRQPIFRLLHPKNRLRSRFLRIPAFDQRFPSDVLDLKLCVGSDYHCQLFQQRRRICK